jgi:DNA repair protein RadC
LLPARRAKACPHHVGELGTGSPFSLVDGEPVLDWTGKRLEMLNIHIKDALSGASVGGILRSRDTPGLGDALERLVGEEAASSIIAWAGIVGLRHMSAVELANAASIALETAERVVASRELEAALQSYAEPELKCSKDVVRALPRDLASLETEVMLGCALNARARLASMVLLGRGGAGQAALTPKDVFLPMIRLGARAMVLVHNHPSRCVDPSDDDIRFTNHIFGIGRTLGVPLLDHLIVGGRDVFSFSDAGFLPTPSSLDDMFDHTDG